MAFPSRRRGAVAATVLALAAAPSAAVAQAPAPGAPGLGDPLFPGLGNGGYDVQHYVLDMTYATAVPTDPVRGTVTVIARATQALSRFNLDWAGGDIGGVTVNGGPAAWTREGEELVVTPAAPLRSGGTFEVVVRDFVVRPTEPTEAFESTALFFGESGRVMAAQPNAAHFAYPSNDHPSDKATFAFRFDVPRGTTAVANGVQTGHRVLGDREVWTYLMRQPMATELTQMAVGDFAVIHRADVGRVEVRDVVPRSLAEELGPKLAVERTMLNFMRQHVGEHPFGVFGSLVIDQPLLFFALETQTLPIYAESLFGAPPAIYESTMVHELAHEWFGNAVSPASWSDLWINEGHATWYAILYSASKGALDETFGAATVGELMRQLYAQGDEFRGAFGPVAEPRLESFYSPQAYEGGALVLYALRQQVGARVFERIEREWIRRYSGGSASTAGFIALASEISGQDLTAFLTAWLYGTTTPPMPGHPDWQQAPQPRSRTMATIPTTTMKARRAGSGSLRP